MSLVFYNRHSINIYCPFLWKKQLQSPPSYSLLLAVPYISLSTDKHTDHQRDSHELHKDI